MPVPEAARYLEIACIRIELEGLAAAAAAEATTPERIAALRRLVARHEAAIARDDWPAAAEHNQRFHFALAEAAEMPTLLGILERLWLRMGPLIAGYYAASRREMTAHHHEILSAMAARDADAARAAMGRDIMGPRDGIVTHISTLALEALDDEAASTKKERR